jgi:hypothetical protein
MVALSLSRPGRVALPQPAISQQCFPDRFSRFGRFPTFHCT